MAMKNSQAGSMSVSEICSFICEHFPYFRTASKACNRSIRNPLSSNECFEKIEHKIVDGVLRTKYLWTMNPLKIGKMDEKIQKCLCKYPINIPSATAVPENCQH